MISIILLLSSIIYAQEPYETATTLHYINNPMPYEYQFVLFEPISFMHNFPKNLIQDSSKYLIPYNIKTIECDNTSYLFKKKIKPENNVTRQPCSVFEPKKR